MPVKEKLYCQIAGTVEHEAGSKEVEFINELEIKSDFVFEKYVADSFSNPKLHEFLLSRQIDTVEVIGVDGGGCVAMTAIHAIKNGYRVIVNEKAIGTTPGLKRKKLKYDKKLKKLGAEFIY